MFCWNCGEKNTKDAAFCESCGEKLDTQEVPSVIENQSAPIEQPSVSDLQYVPRTPMGKKEKVIIGLSVLVIASLSGAYVGGKYYYSYDNQLKRHADVFKSKDPKKIAEIVSSDDPNYNVSETEIKKMTDYYSKEENKEAYSKFIKGMTSNPSSLKDIKLVNNGKYFMLFDKYDYKVEPVYISIEKTQPEVDIKIDDKKVESSKKETTIKVGPLTPGSYKITGSLKDVTSETNVTLICFNNDEFKGNDPITIDLHKVSFVIETNVEGADVLIDNKKVNTMEKDKLIIKDVVWHQGMTVKLEKTVGKDKMTSDSYELSSDDFLVDDFDQDSNSSTVSLTFDNIQSKDDATYFLDSFYSEVEDATDDSLSFSESVKTDFSKYFVNGKENADYKDFVQFIEQVRKSDAKSYVRARPTVEKLSMGDINTYTAQYIIEYKTVYSSYKNPDITQEFRYKKATLIFDEKEDTFKINDLGGKENFEVVDNGGV